ncbi:MerR family transcriptional regulator, partial [Chloroflexota bacterium]
MLTGVVAHRIRRFEQAGLLDPARTESRQRLFSDRGIELIQEIAKLEDQGINMPGIKVILEMRKGGKD